MIIKQEVHCSDEWNSVIRDLPGVSFLQTWEWGQVKAAFGWKSSHFIWRDDTGKAIAAAMILMKEISPPIIPAKFRTLYIPQGPLMDWTNKSLRKKVLTDISAHAKDIRAISIKMDPEVIRGFGEEISEADERNVFANQLTNGLIASGWQYSTQQIQFKNTAWIDLNKSEELLLSSMKQKTR